MSSESVLDEVPGSGRGSAELRRNLPERDVEPASGWAGSASERGHFRPDIEGLRAVAVIAVLLFHVGLPGFAGGFIGVDVFYVISGFLITGLLRRELLNSGRIDLVSFYARRARRLLPAALIVIGATVVLSFLILPRIRWPDIAADAAAAALYVSNYRFALEGLDYLGDPRLSPLLHYWSLAVEEQFYLFWPLLVIVAARWLGLRRLGWMIVAVALVSFVASVVLTDAAAPLAFFSLPTRAWQLAVGAGLAVAPEPLSARIPAWGYRTIGLVGLLLVVGSAVLIDPASSYPDMVALVPTLGAAMVVAAGVAPGGVSRWLSTSIPRWLGRISYSLYLWHWPLLILAPVAIGQNGLELRVGLGVLAIALAHFSTRFIEQPFRIRAGTGRGAPRLVITAGVTASIAMASLTMGVALLLAPPSTPTVSAIELERDARDPAAILGQPRTAGPIGTDIKGALEWASRDVPPSKRTGCQVTKLSIDPTPCIYGVENAPVTVALLGDSHAAQWLPALIKLADANGWRVASFSKPACPPIAGVIWDSNFQRGYDECVTWLNAVEARLATDRPHMIIVSSAHRYQLYHEGRIIPIADGLAEWQAAIAGMLRRLATITANVAWLSDTPFNASNPLDCLALKQDFAECSTPREVAISSAYESAERAAAESAGVTFVSMNDLICPGSPCPVAFADYLVYRDSGHLTATFNTLLSKPLWERLPLASPPG